LCRLFSLFSLVTLVNMFLSPVLVTINMSSQLAVDQYDMSTLETVCSGAAPLGAALSKQVINRFMPKRKGKNPLKILQG